MRAYVPVLVRVCARVAGPITGPLGLRRVPRGSFLRDGRPAARPPAVAPGPSPAIPRLPAPEVLEGGGGGGFGWDPPSSYGPPIVPAERGPKHVLSSMQISDCQPQTLEGEEGGGS